MDIFKRRTRRNELGIVRYIFWRNLSQNGCMHCMTIHICMYAYPSFLRDSIDLFDILFWRNLSQNGGKHCETMHICMYAYTTSYTNLQVHTKIHRIFPESNATMALYTFLNFLIFLVWLFLPITCAGAEATIQ